MNKSHYLYGHLHPVPVTIDTSADGQMHCFRWENLRPIRIAAPSGTSLKEITKDQFDEILIAMIKNLAQKLSISKEKVDFVGLAIKSIIDNG